ncbi:hypothetical protein [Tahibacter harae]|uniref:Big-1 domain-containing protein n=1 Tax=Tahibacter harae TaxID=2963937 RepID=A0ABT1QR29_9GAMM|nr:hypothetical protein [Tahibacter harae]MCQ4164761.1 hypothetical protein [Tahibacter harae]
MRAIKRCLGLLAASLMLASCGGGGGSGGDGAFQPTPSGTLTITATTSELPMNRDGVGPFFGSPFMAELDITWRRANGDLVSGQEVAVAISPVSVAGFSTLDDPETQIQLDGNGNYLRGNEFLDILGSGPVDVTAGHAKIFVHSSNISGVATITVTARDSQSSNTTISKTFNVTVIPGTSSLPASITLDASPRNVYLADAGGSSSSIINAVVRDGTGQLVPNPGTGNTGFNNVQLEVIGGESYGTLSVTGSTAAVVKARTIQGVAAASFSSATQQGVVQIRATADRADGNVDNGIANPVAVTTSIVVSDGKLFDLALTTPTEDALFTGNVTASTTNQPNGTYGLIVSALATDRQGNPVAPGTPIRFGAVDSPLIGFPAEGPGRLAIAGTDGDPQEGGTLFTAPTGRFTAPGHRPGPGDTLLVFADLVPGNRDLESARQITTVNTATSLNVSVPFNRNDDTGNSVNNGPVLPYAIGRAQSATIVDRGNFAGIGALGITNAQGVATAILNYPVNQLGKRVYVYAQGDGINAGSAIKKVTDIGAFVFAGMKEGRLFANPTSISGNTTAAVTVCLLDELGAPIQGVAVGFAFSGLASGAQGFVDNIPGSGIVEDRTGPNGCTVAMARTVGVNDSGGGNSEPKLNFYVDELTDEVEITAGGEGSLTAAPSHFRGTGGVITLTLRDSAGNPVPGVMINSSCEGDVSLTVPAGATNAQGQTTATVVASGLNGYNTAGEGTCTFTASTGETTEVGFDGIDFCENPDGISPPPDPQLCGDDNTDPVTLTVVVTPSANCTLTVVSNPAGLSCSAPFSTTGQNCASDFDQGETVTLTAVTSPAAPACPATRTITFSGGCAPTGGSGNQARVTLNTAQSCSVTVTQ